MIKKRISLKRVKLLESSKGRDGVSSR